MNMKKKMASYALLGMMGIGALGTTGVDVSFQAAARQQPAVQAAAADDITGISLEAEMRAMIEQGILFGYKNSTYAPDEPVTRGQFAAFIARALGLPASEKSGFTDVPASSSLAGSINAAAEAGLMSGYANGQFGLNDSVTREQMAQIISSALHYLEVPEEETAAVEFTDEAHTATAFQAAVERLSSLGIIKGVENLDASGAAAGTVRFDPKSAASRAQAAAFISRMLDAAEQEETAETPPAMPDDQPGQPPAGGGPGGGQTAEPKESIMDVIDSYLSDAEPGQSAAEAELANAFLATLTEEQANTVQYEFTAENAAHWTNLPANSTNRNGAALGDLSDESIAAALELAAAALSEQGFETLTEIIKSDEFLTEDTGRTEWGSGLYYIAILGTPSETGTWMLQISGHHLAENIVFKSSETSVTPQFTGTEPQTFKLGGVTYSPIETRRSGLYAIIESLTDQQLIEAKVSASFNDVAVGAGQDGNFPVNREGILYTDLTAEQQAFVQTAIKAWVKDAGTETADQLLDAYLSEKALADTYIGWSGSTDSNTAGSYVRIDGPRIWLELASQAGVAYSDNLSEDAHFHTVWRDKLTDYAGAFTE